jgi:hypothetical protein
MEDKLQKNAFITYEADAWFERNKDYLKNYVAQDDRVANLIDRYNLNPDNLLEIGCSSNFRLNGIKSFTSSKLYYLLDKSTLSHDTKKLDASNDYFNKYSISTLKKDINASYK